MTRRLSQITSIDLLLLLATNLKKYRIFYLGFINFVWLHKIEIDNLSSFPILV